MSDIVDVLRRDLDGAPDLDALLRAAWDALTVAAVGAHALAWREGIDPVAALAAAAASGAGRDLLPLPAGGAPPQLPTDVSTTLTDALADVLEQLQARLDQAGREAADPQLLFTLHAVADRSGEAAGCLRNLREAP